MSLTRRGAHCSLVFLCLGLARGVAAPGRLAFPRSLGTRRSQRLSRRLVAWRRGPLRRRWVARKRLAALHARTRRSLPCAPGTLTLARGPGLGCGRLAQDGLALLVDGGHRSSAGCRWIPLERNLYFIAIVDVTGRALSKLSTSMDSHAGAQV